MLDLGWVEMAVVALVALLILGPKELPNALRTVTLWVRKARKLAREFQSGVDELVREAELDEARKTVQSVGRVNVNREIEKTIDPTGEVTRSLTTDPEKGTKPPAATPATPEIDHAKPTTGGGASEAAPAAEHSSRPSIDPGSSDPGSSIEPESGNPPNQPVREPAEAPSTKSA